MFFFQEEANKATKNCLKNVGNRTIDSFGRRSGENNGDGPANKRRRIYSGSSSLSSESGQSDSSRQSGSSLSSVFSDHLIGKKVHDWSPGSPTDEELLEFIERLDDETRQEKNAQKNSETSE